MCGSTREVRWKTLRQVGLEDRVPLVRRHLRQRAVAGDPGVVDEHVDLAEALDDARRRPARWRRDPGRRSRTRTPGPRTPRSRRRPRRRASCVVRRSRRPRTRPARPSSSAIARPMPRDPPVTRQALPVSSVIAETSSTRPRRDEVAGEIAGHLGGHELPVSACAASVAFAVALTVDCQVSRVACWVRLTSSENCATACRLPFTPRSNRPRPASIAAFCASNAVLRTASLWVDQVPSRSRPRALAVVERRIARPRSRPWRSRCCCGPPARRCGWLPRRQRLPTRASRSSWWTSRSSFDYYPAASICATTLGAVCT